MLLKYTEKTVQRGSPALVELGSAVSPAEDVSPSGAAENRSWERSAEKRLG